MSSRATCSIPQPIRWQSSLMRKELTLSNTHTRASAGTHSFTYKRHSLCVSIRCSASYKVVAERLDALGKM